MEKKQKIIITIIIILLVILITLGVYLFLSYNSTEKGYGEPNTQFEDSEEASNSEEDSVDWAGSAVVYYSSQEEVIEAINNEWVSGGVTASFESEDEDCWYFIDTNNDRYSYCKSDPTIKNLGPKS